MSEWDCFGGDKTCLDPPSTTNENEVSQFCMCEELGFWNDIRDRNKEKHSDESQPPTT